MQGAVHQDCGPHPEDHFQLSFAFLRASSGHDRVPSGLDLLCLLLPAEPTVPWLTIAWCIGQQLNSQHHMPFVKSSTSPAIAILPARRAAEIPARKTTSKHCQWPATCRRASVAKKLHPVKLHEALLVTLPESAPMRDVRRDISATRSLAAC